MSGPGSGRFVRLAETDRATVAFTIDGRPASALAGDTLLVAVLMNASSVRATGAPGVRRAGFCLMGACQDCWVWTRQGERLRACTTPVAAGIEVLTEAPEDRWPTLA
ncbi:MAG: (2Fe-2S)-binding protein [Rhizobiales bacterium]|nr:(2Fe-2S)-binding protein [Hyphomicrobiales bacterium]